MGERVVRNDEVGSSILLFSTKSQILTGIGWDFFLATTETTKTTVDFSIDQLDDQRIYRIYRELELNMRIKPRKRLVREQPEPLTRAVCSQ